MNDAVRYLATIPSPTQGTWYIAGFPLRAYAVCIIAGIVAAVLIAEYRMRKRGAPHWLTLDIAVFAVPAGIIGGRIYHVITSPDNYFGSNGNPVKASPARREGSSTSTSTSSTRALASPTAT